MDENLENKPKGFQRTKTLKVLEIIILVLLVCLLGSVIYDQYIAKDKDKPETTAGETAGLSDADKDKILSILDISEDGYPKEVHLDIPANADLKPYNFQAIILDVEKTGDFKINDLTNDQIKTILYGYAENNKLLVNIDAPVGLCNAQEDENGNGWCPTITPETYNKIAKIFGITKTGKDVFGNQVYNDNFYFNYGGYTLTPVTITDKVTFEESDNLVKAIYDIKVENTDNAVTNNKTITYNFKKDGSDYVLTNINIKDNLAVYNGELPTESSETN